MGSQIPAIKEIIFLGSTRNSKSAAHHNSSFFHYHDSIAINDRVQSVGYRQHGAPCKFRPYSFLNNGIGSAILKSKIEFKFY